MMSSTVMLRWQLLALTILVLLVLWLLAPVLTPFAAAALLAYMGDPLADRLERWGMGRTLAVSIVFAVMLLVLVGVLLLLIPLIQRQIVHLIQSIPDYLAWFQQVATPWLEQKLGFQLESFDAERIIVLAREHMASAGGVAANVVASVSQSGLAIVGFLINLALVPVVAFYLLRDWDALVERIRELLPRSVEPTISRLARDSNSILGAFVRGQLLVMLALGLIYGIGLWLVGLDLGPLIGMIAGLVSFVPYLGFIVGLIASLIAVVVQFHDWFHIGLVLLVFGIGQAMEGYVLTPRLVGGKIGLHPVAVIFAVLAGGELFGFLGVLLALPVASVVMVVLRFAHQRYLESALYREPATQRVVATEPGDAEVASTPRRSSPAGDDDPSNG